MGSISCGIPNVPPPSEEVLKFLSSVTLFKQLPKELFPVLAAISSKVEFEAGQDIFRQGEVGTDFYVIADGEAKVIVDGKEEARMKANDYFGERALLHDLPRAATITAETKIVALTISRAMFQQLGLHQKLHFANRNAVGGAAGNAATKPPSPKTDEERALMKKAIQGNANLTAIVSNMDENGLNAIIDIAWKEHVAAGQHLIVQGDVAADYFYIVQEGSFEFLVTQTKEGPLSAWDKILEASNVGGCGAGGSFGELALLYLAPRAATVKAKESSVIWVIDRGNFKKVLAQASDKVALDYIKYLEKVEVLAALQTPEKEALSKALTEMFFSKGELILKQGEAGETFYILIDGEVTVIQNGTEVNKLTATAEKACFFGEKALLEKEPRNATIRVESDWAKTLMMDKKTFDLVLGKNLLDPSKKADLAGAVAEDAKAKGKGGRQFGLIKMKDLTVVGLLGNGGFGSVSLVEHKESHETYALKMLSKGYVVQANMQTSIIAEKNIQLMCDSDFIIKLFETYSDDQSCWFLLEVALGGELYATYSRKGFHGKLKHARFYAAAVVFAFEHLHDLKVVYRDLKPENMLLTESGTMKLTDMGLAKVIVGKTYTTCGTPDYFAPEMVASAGHTHSVDWWTLGILVFEFMSGHPPFESATPMQTYQKISHGINKVNFPRACRGPIEDLIKGLCYKNPSKRLPMKPGGTDNIKSHPWYKDFDWMGMEKMTLTPPYVPEVGSKKDLKNFHARPQDAPPVVKHKDDGSGWDKGFATST